jgi:hypothetical protein
LTPSGPPRPAPGPHVDRTPASSVDPEHVFSQFVHATDRLVPDARPAVAVTQTDLPPPQPLPPSPYTTPGAADEWLRRVPGLGNLLDGTPFAAHAHARSVT